MSSSPYRIPLPPAKRIPLAMKPFKDGAALAVLGLLWAVSLVRVLGGLLAHEVFGAEATLALAAVLAVPWLIWGRSIRAGRS